MKTTTTRNVIAGVMIASCFAITPLFAANASSTASVHINGNGVVQVINAEVTGISGNLISAITRFKNSVMNWTFTTNASTTIKANNSLSGTLSDIRVGDKLHVKASTGTLASSTSLVATKIQDVSSMQSWKTKEGTVQSVNASSGSFVLKTREKTLTVAGTASTTIKQSFSTSTLTLATIPLNSRVVVTGRLSADGTSLLASRVLVITTPSTATSSKKLLGRGSLHGLKLGWILNGKN